MASRKGLRSTLAQQRALWDPRAATIDVALRFREVDRLKQSNRVAPTGRVSRIYGGRYDRFLPTGDGTLGAYLPGVDPASLVHAVYDCNPTQFAILTNDDATHLLAVGSRGSSKSELVARWLPKIAAQWPKKMLATLVQRHAKAKRWLRRKLVPLLPQMWLRAASYTPGDTAITLRTHTLLGFYSAAASDDAIGDNTVAIAVEERQSLQHEHVDSAFLTMREAGRLFRTLEVGTLRAGAFEEYVAACRENALYAVYDLSITDNVHLEHVYDEHYGCEVPALVPAMRARMDPLLFKQEIGEWIAAEQRFRCIPAHDTGRVYWGFTKKQHVRAYEGEDEARAFVRKHTASIARHVGDDITSKTLAQRSNEDRDIVVGVHLEHAPMAAVVARILAAPPGWPPIVWVVDEVELADEADGIRLARRLSDQGHSGAMVIPDAAGKHSTGGRSTLAQLSAAGFCVRGPHRNPADEDRINAVRAKLVNGDNRVSLFVDPKCDRLIKALADERFTRTRKPAVLEDGGHHFTYALGYLLDYLFSARRAARDAA